MRKIAQTLDPADGSAFAAIDDQKRPGLAFHDQAKIAGAAQVVSQGGGGQREGRGQGEQGKGKGLQHHGSCVIR